jgi:L-glutamine---4-(methylsulfanyl)-2-oxobutanoate aminotransferase
VGPPVHVVEALRESALDPSVHGYPPIRGLPRTKEAIAERYRTVYGVELDPATEVALVPSSKSALAELPLALCDEGDTLLLPDPYYPDYPSGPAFAGARMETLPLRPEHGWAPDLDSAPDAAALYLNYPSNPCAVCAPPGVFESALRWSARTGGWVVHDAAYIDLVYDGREPVSFLATPGAKDAGVEVFSMSKTYGMAGWRLGFALGNAELVARIENLQNHQFAGIFMPVQEAGIAALTGPQDSVEERRLTYEARRARSLDALAGVEARCEGTFFVWFELPGDLSADRLLEEYRVAVAPGEGFGERGRGWARLSLATPDDKLDLGLQRLNDALR